MSTDSSVALDRVQTFTSAPASLTEAIVGGGVTITPGPIPPVTEVLSAKPSSDLSEEGFASFLEHVGLSRDKFNGFDAEKQTKIRAGAALFHKKRGWHSELNAKEEGVRAAVKDGFKFLHFPDMYFYWKRKPHIGVTLMYRQVRSPNGVPSLQVSLAIPAEGDVFCRRVGRIVAADRMASDNFFIIPTIPLFGNKDVVPNAAAETNPAARRELRNSDWGELAQTLVDLSRNALDVFGYSASGETPAWAKKARDTRLATAHEAEAVRRARRALNAAENALARARGEFVNGPKTAPTAP